MRLFHSVFPPGLSLEQEAGAWLFGHQGNLARDPLWMTGSKAVLLPTLGDPFVLADPLLHAMRNRKGVVLVDGSGGQGSVGRFLAMARLSGRRHEAHVIDVRSQWRQGMGWNAGLLGMASTRFERRRVGQASPFPKGLSARELEAWLFSLWPTHATPNHLADIRWPDPLPGDLVEIFQLLSDKDKTGFWAREGQRLMKASPGWGEFLPGYSVEWMDFHPAHPLPPLLLVLASPDADEEASLATRAILSALQTLVAQPGSTGPGALWIFSDLSLALLPNPATFMADARRQGVSLWSEAGKTPQTLHRLFDFQVYPDSPARPGMGTWPWYRGGRTHKRGWFQVRKTGATGSGTPFSFGLWGDSGEGEDQSDLRMWSFEERLIRSQQQGLMARLEDRVQSKVAKRL
jgi:hypothetical protein